MNTWIGTRETREAREIAEAAAREERDHRDRCIRCIQAARKRRPDERCPAGRNLLEDRQRTAAELKHQRELDKLPAPGQAPLFTEGEISDQ